MYSLTNKHILLGLSGSVAAYKGAELVRRLREHGAEVRVVMTAGAQEFITPLTLQALSGHPVHRDLLDEESEAAMGHIELARWADAVLVAPASAGFIARIVRGEAGDLLTAVCLATTAPVALAPAMNQQMWQSAATRDNVRTLRSRGIHLFGPASGDQACGEVGPGRMLEPEAIALAIARLFETGSLAGQTVVITAGPTCEDIDPVRFISNRSSGRMGFALATACVEAGARTILISGPVALDTPERVTRIDVRSAADMLAAVEAQMEGCDIFIAAAAVADYRPVQQAADKIKKAGATLTLTLERTPDILAMVAARTQPPFTLGFAAETDPQQLMDYARDKLVHKRLDMVAANRVGADEAGTPVGFDVDENALLVLWANEHTQLPLMPKPKLARQLIALLADRYHAVQSVA